MARKIWLPEIGRIATMRAAIRALGELKLRPSAIRNRFAIKPTAAVNCMCKSSPDLWISGTLGIFGSDTV
jgi:hypothetical protein